MKPQELIEHLNKCMKNDTGIDDDYSVDIRLYLQMFEYENDAYNELYSRIKQKQRWKEEYEKIKSN
jgi:hypothetical protein